ncbi:MAG: universal stress protein, partial [Luteitalea sp.]
MSILCAVDFSPPSSVALTSAARIAATFAQPLTVLTVADPLLATAQRLHAGDDPLALLAQALTDFVDDTLGAGAAAAHRNVVAIGDPSVEILRAADTGGAQLIVLGTQGATGVSKVMCGSVAEQVLHAATRPVLVVPPAVATGQMRTIGELEEVLVPVDFHDHVLDDGRVAARVARASHATVRLLHVMPGDEGGRWTVLPTPIDLEVRDQPDQATSAQGKALEALQRLADALGLEPMPDLEVAQGLVSEEIAEVANRETVDLIVLGLHGGTGLFTVRVG